MKKTQNVRTKKLVSMTIAHRIVMILWSYLYLSLGIIAITQEHYGAFAAAIVLNILNMFIYYLYHKLAFRIFRIKDEE
jgi:hypothetical protein